MNAVPQGMNEGPALREAFAYIIETLHDATEFSQAEAALDEVAGLLGMHWPCWVADISYPYPSAQQDEFSRSHGWPEELIEVFQNRHAALKMPFYIRCRFEHLPFVSMVETKRRRHPERQSPEYVRLSELSSAMGITTMLTVPLHMPKGQIAMLTWAGDRDPEELRAIAWTVTGDLLGIGHNFMRLYNAQIGQAKASMEEFARLTPREWDCLRTLAQGYRESEVAGVAGISRATVRFHLTNVAKKFGCKSRAQVVAMAAQLGLLGPVGQ